MNRKNLIYDSINKIYNCMKYEYQFIDSPIIDNIYNVFEFLQIEKNSKHQVLSSKDTFFLDENTVLRPHSSNIQNHIINKYKNEIEEIYQDQNKILKYFNIGRVFRKDDSSRHSYFFHQCDGLIFQQKINYNEIFEKLKNLFENIISKEIKIRIRESYFPFTFPSFEFDIWNENLWIEIMGCGIMHENIIKSSNLLNEKLQCFAFGIGVERIGFILNNINNIKNMRLS